VVFLEIEKATRRVAGRTDCGSKAVFRVFRASHRAADLRHQMQTGLKSVGKRHFYPNGDKRPFQFQRGKADPTPTGEEKTGFNKDWAPQGGAGPLGLR
jgi:hypothetical protein